MRSADDKRANLRRLKLRADRGNAASWIQDAIRHWEPLIDESDLGCDADEWHHRCWCCGNKRKLQRCHIVAKQFGGTLRPDNVIPLCAECHDEAPDVNDPQFMWDWLKVNSSSCHGDRHIRKVDRELLDLCGKTLMQIVHDMPKDQHSVFIQKHEEYQASVGLHLAQTTKAGCKTKASSSAWAIIQAWRDCRQGD
jgi:hypothetical protein